MALGALPALVLALWAAWLWRRGANRADALLAAALDGAAWLVAGTELLGLAGALRFPFVVSWWGVPLLALLFVHARASRPRSASPSRPLTENAGDRILMTVVVLVAGWAFLQAVLAAPNTVDALGYHLPRQVYWSQQASVAHFATGSLRQLTMPPLSEFAGLHLLVLSGGDRWHNLVQWAALMTTLVAVGALTRHAGGGRRAQWLAVLFFATIPSAFVEASGPKNDLLVSLWLALAALGVARAAPAGGSAADVRLGVALGALALTKGTGLVFAVPIVLLLAARWLRAAPRRIAIVALVVVVMNLGHWTRNLSAFGSAYGPEREAHGERLRNEIVTPAVVASNAVRNLGRELALPWAAWNRALGASIVAAHRAIGLSADDPRTTCRQPSYFLPGFFPDDEDTATAPVQVALALVLPAMLWRRRTAPGLPTAATGLAVAAVGFGVFCAVFKWQAWHPRVLFPLLALVAPAFGLVAASWSRAAWALAPAMVAALLPSLNFVQRPLLGARSLFVTGRADSLCNSVLEARLPVAAAVAVARAMPVGTIGIVNWRFRSEYAFQSALRDRLQKPPRFSAFNAWFVPPGTREAEPDLVIALGTSLRLLHIGSQAPFVALAHSGGFTFYIPDPGPAAAREAALIVTGTLGPSRPAGDGVLRMSKVAVEEVLAGDLPAGGVEILSTEPALDDRLLTRSVVPPPGTRGVFLLTPAVQGAYRLPSAGHVRPLAERDRVVAALGTVRGR